MLSEEHLYTLWAHLPLFNGQRKHCPPHSWSALHCPFQTQQDTEASLPARRACSWLPVVLHDNQLRLWLQGRWASCQRSSLQTSSSALLRTDMGTGMWPPWSRMGAYKRWSSRR